MRPVFEIPGAASRVSTDMPRLAILGAALFGAFVLAASIVLRLGASGSDGIARPGPETVARESARVHAVSDVAPVGVGPAPAAPAVRTVAPPLAAVPSRGPGVVRGSVLDGAGRGVAGASVRVTSWSSSHDRPGDVVAEGAADAAGEFGIDAPFDWRFVGLVVTAPGFVGSTTRGEVGADHRIRLERGHPMTGVVLDAEGAPVAGARVSRESEATITTGSGFFVLDGLRRGEPIRLEVHAPGYLPQVHDVLLDRDADTHAEVRLLPTKTLRWRVLDATTETPLAGVRVWAFDETVATSGPDGTFELAVLAGPEDAWMRGPAVTLELDGYAPAHRWLTERAETHDLTMPRAATVRGVVRDADGTPRPGMHVTATPKRRESGPLWWGLRSPFRRTDGHGRFELTDVEPGPFGVELKVHREGFEDELLVDVTRAGQVAEVELVLSASGTVRGRVVGPEGPLHATVSVRRGRWEQEVTADANGEYAVTEVPLGEVSVRASAGIDHVSVRRKLVLSGAHRADFTLEPRTTFPVTGRVVDERGRPYPGALVLPGEVRTAADGTFAFRTGQNPVTVVARADPALAKSVAVETPAEDLELVLPRPGELRLEIVDAETGLPIVEPKIETRPDISRFRRIAPAPGSHGLHGVRLPAGEHDLRVSEWSGSWVPAVRLGVRVDPGSTTPLRVELERGVTLRIEPREWPHEWNGTITVRATKPDPWTGHPWSTNRLVDATGALELHGLPPDTYVLASSSGGTFVPSEVVVDATWENQAWAPTWIPPADGERIDPIVPCVW